MIQRDVDAFERALLGAASDPDAARRLSALCRPLAVLAVTTRGLAAGPQDPVRALSLVARVHHLLGVHAVQAGGGPCPSGTDVGLAWLPDAGAALDAALALVGELEAGRPASSHRHGGLVGVGLAAGDALHTPDGRLLGVPVARALRLAVLGAGTGELLAEAEALRDRPLPAGIGLHQARPGAAERLGFPFVHLADYR